MRVLLAVCRSPCSDAAITEVASRAWPPGSEVIVLSVVYSHAPQIPDPFFILYAAHEESLEEEQTGAARRVEDAVEKIRENPTISRVESETMEGSPMKSILKEAARLSADLVVLGCHGYGRFGRLLHGSVSQAVVPNAPCSVEIVHSPTGTG